MWDKFIQWFASLSVFVFPYSCCAHRCLGRSEFLRQGKQRQGFLDVPSLLQYCTLYGYIWMMHPLHLELILLCSRTIPIFARQRNMNVLFFANCNADSLQWIHFVSVETWRSTKGEFRRSISPEHLRVPDNVLKLNGRDIPFVNDVTCLSVTFDRRMAWRHHSERTVAKALRTYVRTYSLFKSGRLSTGIKLTLYKVLIKSVKTSACPTWEYVADVHLLKLQHPQNRVLRATGSLHRRTPVRELLMAFKITYVYDYITKLCRTQAEVILNNVNPNVHGIGQEARGIGSMRLKRGGVQALDRSVD
jgi:hypothetical protein